MRRCEPGHAVRLVAHSRYACPDGVPVGRCRSPTAHGATQAGLDVPAAVGVGAFEGAEISVGHAGIGRWKGSGCKKSGSSETFVMLRT